MNSKEQILNLAKKKEIFNCISENPGIHLSELCRSLKIPKTTMFYHLNYLEKNGLILKFKESYSRYYVPSHVGRKERKLLELFRKDIPLSIAIGLMARQCVSRMEISKEASIPPIPPNTIDYYLKKFQKLGVIEPAEYTDDGVIVNWKKPIFLKRKPITNEVIYRLKEPYPFLVYHVLTKYKNCFSELSRPFLDVMEEGGMWDLPDEVESRDERFKRLINLYFELFPIPFCNSTSFF